MSANMIKKRGVNGLGEQDTERSAFTLCITKPHKTVLFLVNRDIVIYNFRAECRCYDFLT